MILAKIINFTSKHERLIKLIENIRGLYRYPEKMVGRKITGHIKEKTDILVFAAHPDDDILGLGTTMIRHRLKGDIIKLAFITNGTARGGESWNTRRGTSEQKSKIRHKEAVQALSLINISSDNIVCLGYPDGGIQRYLQNIAHDILTIIQKSNPKRIYVHCIEGGHRDHDLTSYVVKSVCYYIGYLNVYEWAEYNPKQPLGTKDIKFLSTKFNKQGEMKIEISKEERMIKRRMLACHQSQDVEQFFLQGEALRRADTKNTEKELMEYSQFSPKKLTSLIESFRKSIRKIKPWDYHFKNEGMPYDNKESITKE